MKILFRADASIEIGSGHIMRCMVLAEELKKQGAECIFVCSDSKGNLINQIQECGFCVYSIYLQSQQDVFIDSNETVHLRSQNSKFINERDDAEQTLAATRDQFFDWIVVDHYDLSEDWEMSVRQICNKLMVIDDLANRRHYCDLLLDQNYYKNSNRRYQELIPASCACLLGPSFVLLRQEFNEAKKNLHSRPSEIKRVLVFFGSSDPTNETQKVLIGLKQINLDQIEVDVVVGGTNPHRHLIHEMCNEIAGVNYYCNVSNMAELISRADIGVGAGGSSILERCFLGLPSIVSVLAFNQLRTTEDVASLGAIDYLGSAEPLCSENYTSALLKHIANPDYLKVMSIAGLDLVSGAGTLSVVDVMRKILGQNTVGTGIQDYLS